MRFFLDFFVLTCNISIETCANVLLSWYALRGEALTKKCYAFQMSETFGNCYDDLVLGRCCNRC